jgi:nucleoside-diphosphate-sugar epimerase
MAERALVTGAGGFIGAALVRRLLSDGHPVTALVRPGSDGWRLKDVHDEVRLVDVDLRDRDAVGDAVREVGPEWVFHLAAHGAYSWQDDPAAIVETGVLGTLAVLEAAVAAGARAIVNAGSSSEYGLKSHPPSEGEATAPNSAYAVAKAAATMYGRWLARERGQAVTTLRLYSIYGPWEEPRRLMPTLVSRALQGTLPPLVDPSIARDFVHVDDACDAFLAAARAAEPAVGRIYNVASGSQTTLGQLVELARSLFGVAEEPEWGTYEARSWDTNTWVGDPALIAAELGWSARRSLRDGLMQFADWMRADPERQSRYGAGYNRA